MYTVYSSHEEQSYVICRKTDGSGDFVLSKNKTNSEKNSGFFPMCGNQVERERARATETGRDTERQTGVRKGRETTREEGLTGKSGPVRGNEEWI